jgi:hypothetical protein
MRLTNTRAICKLLLLLLVLAGRPALHVLGGHIAPAQHLTDIYFQLQHSKVWAAARRRQLCTPLTVPWQLQAATWFRDYWGNRRSIQQHQCAAAPW